MQPAFSKPEEVLGAGILGIGSGSLLPNSGLTTGFLSTYTPCSKTSAPPTRRQHSRTQVSGYIILKRQISAPGTSYSKLAIFVLDQREI